MVGRTLPPLTLVSLQSTQVLSLSRSIFSFVARADTMRSAPAVFMFTPCLALFAHLLEGSPTWSMFSLGRVLGWRARGLICGGRGLSDADRICVWSRRHFPRSRKCVWAYLASRCKRRWGAATRLYVVSSSGSSSSTLLN